MSRDSRLIVIKKESACKPGFVEDDHSSGIAVTGDLKRPTRKHGGTPAATCVATSLFGLAPGGVCRAAECCHRRGALLPHHFTLTSFIAEASAVCFLLHFPSAHAAQALPGTSSAGARTFLHISREMQRPSGRLRGHHSGMDPCSQGDSVRAPRRRRTGHFSRDPASSSARAYASLRLAPVSFTA